MVQPDCFARHLNRSDLGKQHHVRTENLPTRFLTARTAAASSEPLQDWRDGAGQMEMVNRRACALERVTLAQSARNNACLLDNAGLTQSNSALLSK